LNGSEVVNLQNRVAARLHDAGVIKAVTKNHLCSTITGGLSRGK
jgi:hypothetical protein